MKKPAPLREFFDPVSSATHRNSRPPASAGNISRTLALALILLRSLAIPESAWASITYPTLIHPGSTASIPKATTCSPIPA